MPRARAGISTAPSRAGEIWASSASQMDSDGAVLGVLANNGPRPALWVWLLPGTKPCSCNSQYSHAVQYVTAGSATMRVVRLDASHATKLGAAWAKWGNNSRVVRGSGRAPASTIRIPEL